MSVWDSDIANSFLMAMRIIIGNSGSGPNDITQIVFERLSDGLVRFQNDKCQNVRNTYIVAFYDWNRSADTY